MPDLYEFTPKDIDGTAASLADLKDKVVMVVNVASRCGLTPQYDGLQRLYDEYRKRGFEILAFPCNQFMEQEPEAEPAIKEFCTVQYGVTFPLFSKIEVNGDGRAPLYEWLTSQDVGPDETGDVKWNFGKFLVGRHGGVIARFAPQVEPCSDEVRTAVQAALAG